MATLPEVLSALVRVLRRDFPEFYPDEVIIRSADYKRRRKIRLPLPRAIPPDSAPEAPRPQPRQQRKGTTEPDPET
jgi:hypothetical protein